MRLQRFKSKIVGFALVLSMMLSAYTLIVQAVQQFNNKSLIDQLSLYGSNDLNKTKTQFHTGEILTVQAKVKEGDVYYVTIYNENGSVFSQNGRIFGSEAVVRVPLNPPDFRPNESYVVVFSASISVYPIPGAFVTDEKMAGFSVVMSDTKLNLTCNYDGTLHNISLKASIANVEGVLVANKTVKFWLQLNTSSYIQDRGWLPLASAETGADGSASFVMGCNLFSGTHHVKAEFAGDGDFSGSANTTQFTTFPASPVIQSVDVTSSAGETELAVRVTDSNGYPLVGKTVVVQDPGSPDSRYAVTDGEGTASVKLGGSESLLDGSARLVALGDLFTSQSEVNFGSSGYMVSSASRAVPTPAIKPAASQSADGLRVSISSAHPYAVLPTQVNATYVGWIQPGSLVDFSFLLDGVRELSRVSVAGRGNSTYSVPLEWCSDVVGQHWITVNLSGSFGAMSAENSVIFDSDPCPSNLQMYTPQVVYGSTALFSLVFTMPTLYQQPDGMGLFNSFNLAPGFLNGTVPYKIDQGVNGSQVSLFKNGTRVGQTMLTNKDGIACINVTMSMGGYAHRTWNFTVVVNNPFFNRTVVKRIVSYSNVTVSAGSGPNQYLKLDCSVGEGNASSNQVCVGAESSVEATASLFGMPVWSAPVNLTFARFVPTCLPTPYNKTAVNAGSLASTLNIPAGANFLRVACIYNKTNACLDGDIAPYKLEKDQNWNACCDGVVGTADLHVLGINLGLSVPPGDPRADINHDGHVGTADLHILGINWALSGHYSPSFGAVASFSNGENRSLDSAGCVAIPAGAQGGNGRVRVYENGQPVGAFFEFFDANSTESLSLRTDTSGAAKGSWTPSTVGDYLVEANLRASFSATVSQNEPTSVREPVCLVKYVQVVKRPVDLNVTCAPSGTRYVDPQYPMEAYADESSDAYVSNLNVPSPQRLRVGVARYTDGSQGINEKLRTFIYFNMPPRHPDALVHRATLYLEGVANFTGYPGDIRYFVAYAANKSWSTEGVHWYDQPGIRTDIAGEPSPGVSRSTTMVEIDVTPIVQAWYNGTLPNYGFVIKDSDETTPIDWTCSVFELSDTDPPSGSLMLDILFDRPAYNVVVNATDPVGSGNPIPGLNIYFSGINKPTDAQGVASFNNVWVSHSQGPAGTFMGLAESSKTSIYQAANASVSYDTRYATNLISLSGNIAKDVVANTPVSFGFRLYCTSLNEPLSGVSVDFYVDPANSSDPFWNPQNATGITGSNGVAWLNWTFNHVGTHFVYASFIGYDPLWEGYYYWDWYKDCDASMVAVVSVIPLSIDFSVSPEEFKPHGSIMLNATVLDLRDNQVFAPSYNYSVDFTEVASYGVTNVWPVTGSGGKFLKTITYPSDTYARAYKALVVSAGGTPQNMVSSAVQLTVGTATRLLLDVTRDYNSTRHVFTCRLLNVSSGVGNEAITLKLNDTAYYSKTNSSGFAQFVFYLSPQANNNKTAFNVVASFGGDSVSTATATMTLLNGTSYDVCTTTQYYFGSAVGFEPSSNSTSLTVTPQTTIGATTLMNTAQMQADAETKGLQVWGPDSFSIFPPFFKLHARVTVDSLGTNVQNWVGLFACGVDSYLGLIYPLHKALEGLTAAEIDMAVSAITSVTAGVITLYWLNMIAAEVSEFSLLGYGIQLGLYTALLFAPVLAAYLLPDVWLSRALLYGIGFALLALTIGAFSNDPQARIFPSILRMQLPGADPVTIAMKYILNSFLTGAITSSNMLLAGIIMINPLMWPFAIITFGMAVTAICLGSIR